MNSLDEMHESSESIALRMRPLHHQSLWRWIGCLGVVAIVVLSLIKPIELGMSVQQGDKYGHLLAYGAVMFWHLMLYPSHRARLRWTAALLVLGVVMEVAQDHLTSTRSMDWRDALANTTGIALAWLLARTSMVHLLAKLDAKLARVKFKAPG